VTVTFRKILLKVTVTFGQLFAFAELTRYILPTVSWFLLANRCTMHEHLLAYFSAEKQESLLFIIIGVVAFIVSFVVWKTDYKTMAFPLIAIGIIQLIVGASVYFRTDAQVQSLTAQLQSAPDQFQKDELARMKTVNANFKLYKLIEVLLLAVGIILSYAFSQSMTWYSIAIGLIAQASIMLLFDLFAEKRAHEYAAALERMLLLAPH
jgi:hypothetical protein